MLVFNLEDLEFIKVSLGKPNPSARGCWYNLESGKIKKTSTKWVEYILYFIYGLNMYIQQNGLVSSNNSSFYLLQDEYGWFINKWGHFMKGMSMANILFSINSYESSQLLFRFALQQFYKLYIYIIIYPIRKKNRKWLSTYNNVLQVCTDNIHSCNTCIYRI